MGGACRVVIRLSAARRDLTVGRVIPRTLLLICLVASDAIAQRPTVPSRGFEPTVTLGLESRHFGGRQEVRQSSTATYDAPLGFSGLLQWPLTRRSAAEVEVAIHPATRQRTEAGYDVRLSDETLTHEAVRVALDWRFKPFVPVYFFGGGGVARVARSATEGSVDPATEPELLFGAGIDLRTHDRTGLRLRYIGLVSFPADPGVPFVAALGPTYDYAWQVGVRLPLRRHPSPIMR